MREEGHTDPLSCVSSKEGVMITLSCPFWKFIFPYHVMTRLVTHYLSHNHMPPTMVPPRSQLDLDQAPSIIPDCDARTITTSTSSNLARYLLYRQPTIILDHLPRHRHTSTSSLTHPPTTTSTLPNAALSLVPNATRCLSLSLRPHTCIPWHYRPCTSAPYPLSPRHHLWPYSRPSTFV